MDHITINVHREMSSENDDDKMFYSMNEDVRQRSNLMNNKIIIIINVQFELPSSLRISNSVVNNKIIGNGCKSSSETSNGDIFGEIRK